MRRIKGKAFIRLFIMVVAVVVVVFILIKGISPPYELMNNNSVGITASNLGSELAEGFGDKWVYEGTQMYTYKDTVSLMGSLIIMIIGGILICCYLLVDFPKADVYTYDFDNKKIKIGRIIVFKNDDTFYGTISERLRQKSMTGRFMIHFSQEFVERNRNCSLVVRAAETSYNEIIKPTINITERMERWKLI